MLVDTHTHLYLQQFDPDRKESVSRSIENGITTLLLPSIDKSHYSLLMKCVKNYPDNCIPMLGIHPTSVKENYLEEIDFIKKEIDQNKYCAIGECGLDYYWDKTYIKEQEIVLRDQIELAIQHKLPLVIHSRKSLQEIFNILTDYKESYIKGVLHCFPGNVPEAKKAIELGFYLGIGGVITYKNATMADVVKNISLDHILLETDAPYLTPAPYRGKRNESAYISIIAEKVAEIKEISFEEVEKATTLNACKLFNLSL